MKKYILLSVLTISSFMGAMSTDLNRLPWECWGSLRLLVQKRDLTLARELLRAGADPNFHDGYDTPLSCAWSKEAITLLLMSGADPKKCEYSILGNIYSQYCGVMRKEHQPASMSDEDWITEGKELMNLAIKAGEDPNKWSGAEHLLHKIIVGNYATKNAKEAFVAFAIRNGANPNLPYFKHGDQKSVYAQLSSLEAHNHWVPFIRKERGWALVGPLLLATRKEQLEDCYMSCLPQDLVRAIGGMLLGGSADHQRLRSRL